MINDKWCWWWWFKMMMVIVMLSMIHDSWTEFQWFWFWFWTWFWWWWFMMMMMIWWWWWWWCMNDLWLMITASCMYGVLLYDSIIRFDYDLIQLRHQTPESRLTAAIKWLREAVGSEAEQPAACRSWGRSGCQAARHDENKCCFTIRRGSSRVWPWAPHANQDATGDCGKIPCSMFCERLLLEGAIHSQRWSSSFAHASVEGNTVPDWQEPATSFVKGLLVLRGCGHCGEIQLQFFQRRQFAVQGVPGRKHVPETTGCGAGLHVTAATRWFSFWNGLWQRGSESERSFFCSLEDCWCWWRWSLFWVSDKLGPGRGLAQESQPREEHDLRECVGAHTCASLLHWHTHGLTVTCYQIITLCCIFWPQCCCSGCAL